MTGKSAGSALAETVSVGAVALSLGSFGALAIVEAYLGPEFDCFPAIKEWLPVLVVLGLTGVGLASAFGCSLALNSLRGVVPPGFTRFAGAIGAVLTLMLLTTPLFGDPIRHLFGMSSHGPLCMPRGWLGADPAAWNALSRRMGYLPPPDALDPRPPR